MSGGALVGALPPTNEPHVAAEGRVSVSEPMAATNPGLLAFGEALAVPSQGCEVKSLLGGALGALPSESELLVAAERYVSATEPVAAASSGPWDSCEVPEMPSQGCEARSLPDAGPLPSAGLLLSTRVSLWGGALGALPSEE